jgi:DNA-binding NarL/FixJ family response regulator
VAYDAGAQTDRQSAMKVLIIDDHALIRDALSRVLSSLESDVAVLEAGEPQAAFAILESQSDIDLVLLDLALPAMHGIAALEFLRKKHPAVSVVVVSASTDRATVQRALDHGALGFIPKSSSNDVMKGALRLILAGGIYVPPSIVGRDDGTKSIVEPSTSAARTTPADVGLTARQAQILALMMKGESNKLICRELNLAESTVKNQITAILKALNVTSRTQAVLAVSKLGLVLPEVRSADR